MGPTHKSKSTRVRKAQPAKPSPRRMPARPQPSPVPELSATLTKAAEVAKALQGVQGKLRLIRSTAAVTAGALHQQNCEMDEDAATVLGRLVVDGLTDQMVEVDLLLGEENESVDEEVAS